MILKFVGKEYRGVDGDKSLIVMKGQSVEVSEQKAAQLLRDFPKDWKAQENKPDLPVQAADKQAEVAAAKVERVDAKASAEPAAPAPARTTPPKPYSPFHRGARSKPKDWKK